MNKKTYFIIILAALFLIPLVSAQFGNLDLGEGMREIIEQIVNFGTPFFEAIIGDYSGSEFLFGKILLLILLIILIKNILDKTPIGQDNKNISLAISVIVSILSIRFINENDFFEAILVQYGTLGIAITTLLPLTIFFYFVHNTKIGPFGRKVFWALYGIIMGVIWISKSNDIPTVANWVYGASIIAIIIFLIFDKTIHSYLGLSGFKKYEKEKNEEAIMEAQKKLDDLREHYETGRMTESKYDKAVRKVEKYITKLSRES